MMLVCYELIESMQLIGEKEFQKRYYNNSNMFSYLINGQKNLLPTNKTIKTLIN